MTRRPRGHGQVMKEGSAWAIRRGAGGKRIYESGFRTRAEAERRLTMLAAEAMQRRLGVAADPKLVPVIDDLSDHWLERRKVTHAAGAEDGSRWRKHIKPWFGHLRPNDVDTARIRAFVEAKREEIAPATVRVVVALLSSFYEDLLERGIANRNPARHLPKSLLRLMRPEHDPQTTPFLERLDDVRRVYLALDPPLNVAFAIGAFGGLRTGEVFALRWLSVDLDSRRIVVRESTKGPVKDREPRVVPILDSLYDVLKEWRLRNPGPGLVVPPMRKDGKKIDKETPGKFLRKALADLGLARDGLGWYECTRHTFASHWVMGGGSIRELQRILGHYSIVMTERYAHLAPDFFSPGIHQRLQVDLRPGAGIVGQIKAGRLARPPA